MTISSFRSAYLDLVSDLYGREMPPDTSLSEAVIAAAEGRLGPRLPPALREYYLALGGFDLLNTAFQKLATPDELEVVDGRLVFLYENQSVVVWGLRPEDLATPDPEVFIGEAEWTQLKGPSKKADPEGNWKLHVPDWESVELSVSQFLELIVYYNTAMGGYDHTGSRDDAGPVLAEVASSWKRVVHHQGLDIWRSGGKLIASLGDDVCYGAARDDGDQRELEKLGFEF